MPEQQKKHYDTSLTDEYIAAVNRPAEVVHDFRHHDDGTTTSLVKEILCGGPEKESEPMAIVISNVLTPSECDELVATAEDFGMACGDQYLARTAKRTKNYTNAVLSQKVEERINDILEDRFRDPSLKNDQENEDNSNVVRISNKKNDGRLPVKSVSSSYMGPFSGIHTNWRVLRYDADCGDAFPAHQDQMDCFQRPKPDGSGRKDLIVSSHTLLIQLSNDNLEGGATRFYPRAKARLTPSDKQNDVSSFRTSQFAHAEDVLLPKGWALIFKQRGLLHAGQPLVASSSCPKYVAQSGVLRVLPEGVLQKPSVFKNGPGVTKGAF